MGHDVLLLQNIDLNGPTCIRIIDQYLGSQENQIPLDLLEVPRDKRGFIKLDADFAELNILHSGERLLVEAKPYLLIETHSAELEHDCVCYLEKLGYQTKIVPNAWWRMIIPEQRPLDHNRWLWAQSC